jgi:hypothetical protein
MGKQYNKVLKRRRRAAYMAKRKLALRELVKDSPKAKTTKTKAAKPKVARKTVAVKKEKVVEPEPEVVAEKANPTDVLGPEATEPPVNESKTAETKEKSEESPEN